MTSADRLASQFSGGVFYPDSDGEPMADNTRQWEWMVTLKENLDEALPDAFVGGDLLWYPVEGDNRTRRAPDVLVALGRPKGHRGSYRQWEEGGVPPQVVVEVWSPGNTFPELMKKVEFYNEFGVGELWLVDPEAMTLSVWTRKGGRLDGMAIRGEWTSPSLGVRFQVEPGDVQVFKPDGSRFLTFAEMSAANDSFRARAEAEKARADDEKARADSAEERADSAEERVRRLTERLRQAGLDPDAL